MGAGLYFLWWLVLKKKMSLSNNQVSQAHFCDELYNKC